MDGFSSTSSDDDEDKDEDHFLNDDYSVAINISNEEDYDAEYYDNNDANVPYGDKNIQTKKSNIVLNLMAQLIESCLHLIAHPLQYLKKNMIRSSKLADYSVYQTKEIENQLKKGLVQSYKWRNKFKIMQIGTIKPLVREKHNKRSKCQDHYDQNYS